ncbi:MAG: hypothetical protein LBK42_03705 [Propionibacteriaceae bacterium]|jgi:hypothetical protein|nr:hypothetical protein [Propionibacteriaceae bacterium]
MSHYDEGPTGFYAEQAALNALGATLLAALPPGLVRIEYKGSFLVSTSMEKMPFFDASGNKDSAPAPDEVTDGARGLRKVMYKPGLGTWFAVRVTVTADGKITSEFDYTNEPDFFSPVSPSSYVDDQHVYPIDEDKQPEWLKRRLAEGYAELNAWGPSKRFPWLIRLVEEGNAPAWLTA